MPSKTLTSLTILLGLTVTLGATAQDATKLLRQPTLSKTDVVFVYGGDLWTVPRTGGTARRLTANPSVKRYPHFSPDGKTIAFTGNYDGNSDVYTIPAEGGEPKRLTYHPFPDEVQGWTPDGRSVLFRSFRTSVSYRVYQLFTVPTTGGLEHRLPMPDGTLASFSPDGEKIAYNRIERELSPWKWKRYRGGAQAYVSIYDIANNRYSEIPHTDTTEMFPMWHGDKIYFVSDRTGTVNLFCYDTKSKAVRQLTRYTDYDVKWPSMGPDGVVYEQSGGLKIFDLTSEKITPIPVQVESDLPAARPALRHVEANITNFSLSPSGARAIFEARGDLFTVPAKKGDTRDLTNTPGVREINPAWSPDGKWIAYLSDKSGEYEIYIRPQDGSGTETRLTTDGKVYRYGPLWSPDSKALLYTDADMKLWMVALADKKPVLLDSSELAPINLGHWSPDSKWIVYTKLLPNQNLGITLYSLEQKKAFPVSDGRFNDHDPVFDQSGKYLYFLSERTFTPSQFAPETGINFQNMTSILALTLQKETSSPFAPESDEEKPKDESARYAAPAKPEDKTGKIDLDGLYRRTVALPVPPGTYAGLSAGTNKVFYLSAGALHQYDLNARADAPVIGGIQAYDINPTGTKIIYQAGPVFGIIDAVPGQQPGAGRLNVALEMRTDPRAEWKQIYNESWRLERDFYYDPNMHGLDWKALGERYAKLLPGVAHRDDLTYLLTELQGELSTSHAFVVGAEAPVGPQVNVGLLGADFEAEGGYYRFKKIYAGESWDETRRAPLTEPGVNVKEGDYLIAVNGVPLKTDTNPYAAFEDTVGKTVTLKVNDKPSEVGAREVRVRPIANEHDLRYLDWIETNRRKVEQATGGRAGYVHIPSTAESGITEFGRGFYSQLDKQALIVDERYNDGGYIPDFFVEKLNRKLLNIATVRHGADSKIPTAAIYGPKAMLTNEWAGSGGDSLPDLFRREGIGPLIGKRTAGGLVGIAGFNTLLDGGQIAMPTFGIWAPQEGKWIAENHGVDPDIEVNNTPDKTQNGGDPQLDRAIAYILDQLKKNPPHQYRHPPFSVDKLAGIKKDSKDRVASKNAGGGAQ